MVKKFILMAGLIFFDQNCSQDAVARLAAPFSGEYGLCEFSPHPDPLQSNLFRGASQRHLEGFFYAIHVVTEDRYQGTLSVWSAKFKCFEREGLLLTGPIVDSTYREDAVVDNLISRMHKEHLDYEKGRLVLKK